MPATGEPFSTSGSLPPQVPFWVDVAAGASTSCGVWSTGDVACWGIDEAIVDHAPHGDFVQVALSADAACARSTDGAVVCWGGRARTQVPDTRYSALFGGGSDHFCGLEVGTGTLVCWGTPDDVPLGLPADPAIVALGNVRTCVLGAPGETPTCWGSEGWSEEPWVLVPPPDIAWRTLSLGSVHGCGVDLDGAVWCWGAAALNSCDDPLPHGCFPPCPFEGPFSNVATWNRDTCVQDAAGIWQCWVEEENWPDPALAAPAVPMVKLSLGNFHGCGLTNDGAILCFGNYGGDGELDPPDAPPD